MKLETPAISSATFTITTSPIVTITAPADGPTPMTNATVYAGPFTSPTSATISAVAFQSGLATGSVAIASF